MDLSFYSTSLYNVNRPIGAVYCATDSIGARVAFPASFGGVSAPGAAAPNSLYTEAYQPYSASVPASAVALAANGRPDKPPVGGMTPVGDALLPLMACVLVYGAWRLRRVLHLLKK